MQSTVPTGLRPLSPRRAGFRALAIAGFLLLAASCSGHGRSSPSSVDSVLSESPQPAPRAEPELVLPPITRSQPSPVTRAADLYVAPVTLGRGDGTTPEDAAGLADLNLVIEGAAPGSVIEMAADRGPYQIKQPITINAGGLPEAPITIRGPLQSGPPTLVGNRSDPYQPDGNPGPVLFRLAEGADHLVFARIHCERIGNGCFNVIGEITDLTIQTVTAHNVRRFFENGTAKAPEDATIAGLTISDVEVVGFSKGAIRLGHDTHDVLIVDVTGDSQHQDGDNFAMGIHLVDTVHDVRLERISMANALDTLHPYWNGDGFTAERGVHNLHFVDTHAAGNSDAGYDLKSSSTLLENVSAERNKRNYRFWGGGVVMTECLGLDPILVGGTGSQIHVQVLEGGTVSIASCRFSDDDPRTVVFSVEDDSVLDLVEVMVEHSPSGELTMVASGAELSQRGVEVTGR